MYAVRSNETIRIYDSFAYRGSIKDMQDRFYDADDKCWVVPLTKENVATLGLLGATLDEELQALTADSTDTKGNAEPTIKPPIKGSLYSHQVKAYNFALKQFDTGKAVAFLMDMGTGKTITTIALIGALNSQKRVGKVLVVSPKSIVGVWEEEFQKFADYRYALTILDGSIAKKKAAFGYMNGSALQVIVVNYESAWRLETEIGKWNPDMIVCDESSKIKNPATAQSKALHKLGKKTKFKAHFEEKIHSNPNWNYVEGYADWGISGTKAESRKEFMRMIDDCRAGKINRVLVKSISRFGRNTVDTLTYIRELRELGISVFFETQNIDTMTAGGDVLITILAAMAEQESRTMSTNIKWAFQKRFKDGRVLINFKQSLGYDKVVNVDENGHKEEEYVIVESEAEIVRMIYREYLSGKTIRQIADQLNELGIRTKRGNEWKPSSIEGMLTNYKYTGNAILGMTYKPDVLSKSRLKNEGQSPSYHVENSHPAIITKEMFDMVQAEIQRRKNIRSTVNTGKGKYSSKYVLSGLLVCGDCGAKFRRFGRSLKSGEFIPTWVCVTHQKNTNDCKMKPIKEQDILDAFKRAVQRLVGDFGEIVKVVRETAEEELKSQQTSNLTAIEDELVEQRKAVLELFKKKRAGEISPMEYDRKYAEYSARIIELESAADTAKSEELQKQLTQSRLERVYELLDNIGTDYTDEGVMRTLIDCIKVEGKHDIEFQFKCGVDIHETI